MKNNNLQDSLFSFWQKPSKEKFLLALCLPRRMCTRGRLIQGK